MCVCVAEGQGKVGQWRKDNLHYMNRLTHGLHRRTLELVIKWLEVCGLGQSKRVALLFGTMPCQINCVASVFQA